MITFVLFKSALISFAPVPVVVGQAAALALIVADVPDPVVVTQANLFINAAKLVASAPA